MATVKTETQVMSDLDMLFDFGKDAEIAAMGYTMAASMARNVKVRKGLERLATMSLEAQQRTIDLLRKEGAKV